MQRSLACLKHKGVDIRVPEWTWHAEAPTAKDSVAFQDALLLQRECKSALLSLSACVEEFPLSFQSECAYLRAKVRLGELCEFVCRDEHFAQATLPRCDALRDSLLCAVWTSAHANAALAPYPNESGLVMPCLALSSLTEPFAMCASACGNATHAEDGLVSHSVHVLATRCMHASDRSWVFAAKKAIRTCAVARHTLALSLRIALTGMHAWLLPSARPLWTTRLRIEQCLNESSTWESASTLCSCVEACKAAMRRTVSDALEPFIADRRALARVDSVRGICSSSCRLEAFASHPEVQCSVRCLQELVRCGAWLVENKKAESWSRITSLTCVPQREKRIKKSRRSDADQACDQTPVLMPVGFATRACKELWHQCFMSLFTSLWAYCCAFQKRASKMTIEHVKLLFRHSAASQLAAGVPERKRLLATRLALEDHAASLRARTEVWTKVKGCDSHASKKSKSSDALLEEMHFCTEEEAGMFLVFARTAALKEHLLLYKLPDETKKLQAHALSLRSMQESGSLAADSQSRFLYICCSCSTVCSACCSTTHIDKEHRSFRQLGVASCLLKGEDGLYCSKRVSAASRLALKNAEALREEVGTSQSVPQISFANDVLQGRADSRMVVRMRRDASAVMMQCDTGPPCGQERLFKIDLLGRVARINNKWFCLCTYCGVIMKFKQLNRYGTHMACLMCDAEFSEVDACSVHAPAAERESTPCRFCGKAAASGRGAPHKRVDCPLDVSGKNSFLPPPLRVCYFCPAHYKSWIPQAMKVLPTRAVLSHIASGAKPLWDPLCEVLERPAASKHKKRRRVL